MSVLQLFKYTALAISLFRSGSIGKVGGVDESTVTLEMVANGITEVNCLPRLAGETIPPTLDTQSGQYSINWWPSSGGSTPHFTEGAGICDASLTKSSEQIIKEVLQKLLHYRQSNTFNGHYEEMVKYFQKETFASPVVVEIGTLWGGLSNSILRAIPTAHWFAIDPLYPSYDIMDEASDLLQFLANDLNLSAPDLSWALSLALTHNQVTNYGCHYHLLWTNSLDASRKFADGSVDVIFVDGEASYAATAADISAWFPKLRKPGGRFIFSNYGNAAFMGVTFAIDDFLRTHPTYNVTFASANSLRITVKLEDDVQVVDRHCAQYTLSTPPGVGPGIVNANCRDFEAKIKPNKLSIMSQVDLIHVVSAGGSGTTAIINHLRAKGLKTNHPHDFDALKHRPFNGVCPYKGLYIYGDSIKVVQSLYRRGYQRQMSLKLSGFTRSVPATAEAYLGQHEDLHFRLKEHMQGWLQCESVMAVTAQDIQNHPKVVADHLGLFLSNVTGFKVHNRTVTNTSGVSRYFQRLSSELTALAANPSKTDRTRKCIAQDEKGKSNSVRSWGLSNMIV